MSHEQYILISADISNKGHPRQSIYFSQVLCILKLPNRRSVRNTSWDTNDSYIMIYHNKLLKRKKILNIFQNPCNCYYDKWASHFSIITPHWNLLQLSRGSGLVDVSNWVLFILKPTNAPEELEPWNRMTFCCKNTVLPFCPFCVVWFGFSVWWVGFFSCLVSCIFLYIT